MSQQNVNGNLSNRIEILDSLRGFALFGIMLSHMACCFNSVDYSAMGSNSIANTIVSVFNWIFISGKFFAIFSFLFGLSFFIQMDRAAQKGINYQWRFLWRIMILLAVGYLHSLLYSGDILSIYAVLGIFLVFMYKVSDKILVILIILLLSGAPRFITYGINHSKSTSATTNKQPQDEGMKKTYLTYKNGSFTDVVKFNAREALINKAEYQLGIEGRVYQTLALFFLGLLIGRRRYFEQIHEKISLTRKVFKWSIWSTIGFLVLAIAFFAISKGDMNTLTLQVAMTFYNLFNLSLALLITTAFILIYQKPQTQNFLRKLIPYGKMGLTNYLIQAIIAVPLFYGFGLGLTEKINLAVATGLGIVIYYSQMQFSKWWMNQYVYGPFEWLWRSLTWLKWQPLRKKKVLVVSNL
jgi:uncharacterized protein